MRFSEASIAYLARREKVVFRWLLWISAKDRVTGLPVNVGFWSGADDRTFVASGQSRPYTGIGELLSVPSLTFEPGPVVRIQTLELKAFSQELEDVISLYDARQAKTELHLALFDAETMNLVSVERALRGRLDGAPARIGRLGSPSGLRLQIASAARLMTLNLPHKKSDAIQSKRQVNGVSDGFRKYASVSGAVTVWWGEQRVVPVQASKSSDPADASSEENIGK
jgi:hypothetical protein